MAQDWTCPFFKFFSVTIKSCRFVHTIICNRFLGWGVNLLRGKSAVIKSHDIKFEKIKLPIKLSHSPPPKKKKQISLGYIMLIGKRKR